jgi:hypothetical protein
MQSKTQNARVQLFYRPPAVATMQPCTYDAAYDASQRTTFATSLVEAAQPSRTAVLASFFIFEMPPRLA